ncbi:NADPH-dependent oxidoreductase [Lentilactobacillus curieae]|uniref:NADPH-dependent oxidoreductase n=1 Tax=Lentilactobacillus curieae TaxID=1138822 RepID=A0A1S6QHQ5_9LACO|nr:NAD(P)H-dependent oxidoreductase [Lentilactobacillus curieae]AQW21130.1 NADPH-dependent oxidoreductase [Lentilactobacillus curieae]
MKILGILGSHKENGVTRMALDTVLNQVKFPNTTDFIYLEDYNFGPDKGDAKDPVLDILESKMLEADVWVIAAPTYWGSLSGKLKDFFDCMRQRLVRIDHLGETHPDKFKDKHYISITDCYMSSIENFVTGVTDQSFRIIDKVMSSAGVIKLNEIVVTNSYGLTELPNNKQRQLRQAGIKLNSAIRKDDNTMKRYIELFFMIAVMALATMGIQSLTGLLANHSFWLMWISFVVIFYVLLACMLHFFTFVKHRRR